MARLTGKESAGEGIVVELSVNGSVYMSENGLINHNCDDCRRLHLLPDGITPRLWRLSELKHGYHKKGEDVPALGGEHPHCRCSLVTMLNGYGFTPDGRITFVSHEHDEFKKQREE